MKGHTVIIGHTGVVGTALLRKFRESGQGATGLSRSSEPEQIDLADPAGSVAVLERLRPSVVILTAALTNVDLCEQKPDASQLLNLDAPTRIAEWCASRDVYLVFFSSDYVFDGAEGPYDERALVNPLNVYGRHKVASEERIQMLLPDRSLIVRTTVVFGEDTRRKNFVLRLLSQLEAGNPVRVPTDQVGTPTLSDELAEVCLGLVEKEVAGVVHAAGKSVLTRYDFALRCAETFGLRTGLIESATTQELKQPARRPLKGGLTSVRPELVGRPLCGVDESLLRFSDSLGQQSSLLG